MKCASAVHSSLVQAASTLESFAARQGHAATSSADAERAQFTNLCRNAFEASRSVSAEQKLIIQGSPDGRLVMLELHSELKKLTEVAEKHFTQASEVAYARETLEPKRRAMIEKIQSRFHEGNTSEDPNILLELCDAVNQAYDSEAPSLQGLHDVAHKAWEKDCEIAIGSRTPHIRANEEYVLEVKEQIESELMAFQKERGNRTAGIRAEIATLRSELTSSAREFKERLSVALVPQAEQIEVLDEAPASETPEAPAEVVVSANAEPDLAPSAQVVEDASPAVLELVSADEESPAATAAVEVLAEESAILAPVAAGTLRFEGQVFPLSQVEPVEPVEPVETVAPVEPRSIALPIVSAVREVPVELSVSAAPKAKPALVAAVPTPEAEEPASEVEVTTAPVVLEASPLAAPSKPMSLPTPATPLRHVGSSRAARFAASITLAGLAVLSLFAANRAVSVHQSQTADQPTPIVSQLPSEERNIAPEVSASAEETAPQSVLAEAPTPELQPLTTPDTLASSAVQPSAETEIPSFSETDFAMMLGADAPSEEPTAIGSEPTASPAPETPAIAEAPAAQPVLISTIKVVEAPELELGSLSSFGPGNVVISAMAQAAPNSPAENSFELGSLDSFAAAAGNQMVIAATELPVQREVAPEVTPELALGDLNSFATQNLPTENLQTAELASPAPVVALETSDISGLGMLDSLAAKGIVPQTANEELAPAPQSSRAGYAAISAEDVELGGLDSMSLSLGTVRVANTADDSTLGATDSLSGNAAPFVSTPSTAQVVEPQQSDSSYIALGGLDSISSGERWVASREEAVATVASSTPGLGSFDSIAAPLAHESYEMLTVPVSGRFSADGLRGASESSGIVRADDDEITLGSLGSFPSSERQTDDSSSVAYLRTAVSDGLGSLDSLSSGFSSQNLQTASNDEQSFSAPIQTASMISFEGIAELGSFSSFPSADRIEPLLGNTDLDSVALGSFDSLTSGATELAGTEPSEWRKKLDPKAKSADARKTASQGAVFRVARSDK
ncbi:MAG: hypothetical protein J0M12_11385 [Deltaproteobacteria bacterium]|nr:hypothetical protein [Deltaproteobacteria bacterium]